MAKSKADAVKAKIWHALKFIAGKETKHSRDLLEAGKASEVALKVEGTVDGREFREEISGTLQVGHDETSSRNKLDEAGFLANLLKLIPKTRHEKVAEGLAAHVTLHGKLPEVTDEERNAAEAILTRLRYRTESKRHGAVRLQRS